MATHSAHSTILRDIAAADATQLAGAIAVALLWLKLFPALREFEGLDRFGGDAIAALPGDDNQTAVIIPIIEEVAAKVVARLRNGELEYSFRIAALGE